MPIVRGAAMAAGQRVHWVQVQGHTTVLEGDYPVETWTDLTGAWMSRIDLRGDERYLADQETAAVETLWGCPYRADLDPDLVDVATVRRLVYRGRVYDVLLATVHGFRDGIELVTQAASGVPALEPGSPAGSPP